MSDGRRDFEHGKDWGTPTVSDGGWPVGYTAEDSGKHVLDMATAAIVAERERCINIVERRVKQVEEGLLEINKWLGSSKIEVAVGVLDKMRLVIEEIRSGDVYT